MQIYSEVVPELYLGSLNTTFLKDQESYGRAYFEKDLVYLYLNYRVWKFDF